MPLARVQYESDGSTTEYSIPFPYISRDDVYVSLDGTETDAWMFLDGSTVKLDSSQPLGTIIDVSRRTERDNLLVEFNDGSTLLETDLTLAAQQSFFIAQEAFDQTGATLTVAEDGSYSANGRRVSQLEWPNSDDDAANQGYVLDVFADGYDAHDERVLAQQARNAAQAAESAAATSESNAATSESNAASSASAASSSESNAATSETNAADSAQEASTYLSSVEADALAASNSADAAADSESNAANSASAASSSESDAQTAATNAQNSEDAAASSASNAATSETNAQSYRDQAQSEASSASSSASAALTSEQNAASSESSAASSETAAQNWAMTAEDTLVPEGDQVDDYSALHWARKAEGWAAGVNMPSATGNGGQLIRQAADESGFEYITAAEGRTLLDVYSTSDVYTTSESDTRYVQNQENSVNFEYSGDGGLIVRTDNNDGVFIFQAQSSGGAPRLTVGHGAPELKGDVSGWNFEGMPQSGGDPIVSSGSNSNGSWVKWADGTMICRAMLTTNEWANWSNYVVWTFPQQFVSDDINVSPNAKRDSTKEVHTVYCSVYWDPPTISAVTVGLWRIGDLINNFTKSNGYVISVVAHGRWK